MRNFVKVLLLGTVLVSVCVFNTDVVAGPSQKDKAAVGWKNGSDGKYHSPKELGANKAQAKTVAEGTVVAGSSQNARPVGVSAQLEYDSDVTWTNWDGKTSMNVVVSDGSTPGYAAGDVYHYENGSWKRLGQVQSRDGNLIVRGSDKSYDGMAGGRLTNGRAITSNKNIGTAIWQNNNSVTEAQAKSALEAAGVIGANGWRVAENGVNKNVVTITDGTHTKTLTQNAGAYYSDNSGKAVASAVPGKDNAIVSSYMINERGTTTHVVIGKNAADPGYAVTQAIKDIYPEAKVDFNGAPQAGQTVTGTIITSDGQSHAFDAQLAENSGNLKGMKVNLTVADNTYAKQHIEAPEVVLQDAVAAAAAGAATGFVAGVATLGTTLNPGLAAEATAAAAFGTTALVNTALDAADGTRIISGDTPRFASQTPANIEADKDVANAAPGTPAASEAEPTVKDKIAAMKRQVLEKAQEEAKAAEAAKNLEKSTSLYNDVIKGKSTLDNASHLAAAYGLTLDDMNNLSAGSSPLGQSVLNYANTKVQNDGIVGQLNSKNSTDVAAGLTAAGKVLTDNKRVILDDLKAKLKAAGVDTTGIDSIAEVADLKSDDRAVQGTVKLAENYQRVMEGDADGSTAARTQAEAVLTKAGFNKAEVDEMMQKGVGAIETQNSEQKAAQKEADKIMKTQQKEAGDNTKDAAAVATAGLEHVTLAKAQEWQTQAADNARAVLDSAGIDSNNALGRAVMNGEHPFDKVADVAGQLGMSADDLIAGKGLSDGAMARFQENTGLDIDTLSKEAKGLGVDFDDGSDLSYTDMAGAVTEGMKNGSVKPEEGQAFLDKIQPGVDMEQTVNDAPKLNNQDTADALNRAADGKASADAAVKEAQGQVKAADGAAVNKVKPQPQVGYANLFDVARTALQTLTPFLAETHLSLRDDINIKAGDIGEAVGAVDSTALGTDLGVDASRPTTIVSGAAMVSQLLQAAKVDLGLLSEDVDVNIEVEKPKPKRVGGNSLSGTSGQLGTYEQQTANTSAEVAEDDTKKEEEDPESAARREEIERRRAELLKQYVNAGIQISEGMNAISNSFPTRAEVIPQFAEGVADESSAYGLVQDVGRYVLFETLRGVALSSVQMGVQASRLLFEQEVLDEKKSK